MSSVDLHPHFVSARDYDDVKTIVGLLKEQIDDDDFVRQDDAPFLPPAYTTTIHITDSLSGVASSRNSISSEATLASRERIVKAGTGANAMSSSHHVDANKHSSNTADAAHVPFGDNATDHARSPLAPDLDAIAAPYPSYIPKSSAPPASATEFKMRRRASSYHKGARQPKILCVWDVDDTLVATGVSGVRQNLVFREQELVSLFRSAGPQTRHLLLSQGSIDDVFDESGGRLRCIQKFVQRPPPAPNGARRAASSAKAGANASSAPTLEKKKSSSFADMLRCGHGKQTKDQPFSSGAHRGGHADEGVGGTNEKDMRHLASGTVVVRLSSMHDRAEQPGDAAFLTNSAMQPTCARTSTVPLDEKAERMGRWLLLRPEVWGITLASMNTIFPPSRYTAFVNGKVYRKMDVVWSLAMTGEWDSVFFVDNNLSEVGVVRYGMQMSDVLNLRGGRQVWRFFQSEFLLLAASAKLRELELRYGRDITKPPPQQNQEGKTNGNNTGKAATRPRDGAAGVGAKGAGSNSELRVQSVATGSGDGAGEGGELTPSKSTATSSLDSAPRNGGTLHGRSRHSAQADSGDVDADVDVDVEEDIKIIVDPPGAPVRASRDYVAANSSSHSDTLSLNSTSPQHPNDLSPAFPPSPPRSPMRSVKDVDLVVVNLHMPCEAYRRVLTTSRTNNDGQRSLQREGAFPARYVGQPVFNGDRSCTDEQYDAILRYFQETESGLFQLLEEEMRMNGFVDVKMSRKWIPGLYTVHAPIPRRPTYIPHMALYYAAYFDEVEERVVQALHKYGGTSASCTLHSEAQRQYFTLQRVLTFIDPYLTGDLGRILFDIYIVDGNIPRSLADQLKKTLYRVRDRIVPKANSK